MFGLREQDIEMITEASKSFEEIDQAVVFGSRALGNYKKGSDIDIAIKGSNVTNHTAGQLSELLNEEYPLPYFFDIVHYEGIKNEALIRHINEHGINIYGEKHNRA
ncbi:nucleotidyltransferase family protein [Lentibacillus salicampi]|uniref:Nucleotidyltransferase domain-containing protein n=1 Tax=Lentibacillus salicampi TaxID=175306 RepID=A0A4Y9AED9_9BACI|nr:nucleotidyltransferase domain-containing protein [Lentibacillus salicampi]TFJ94186.1 nucleotidyltransferase domain-containing protein [Lentibacillus salicampi]